MKRFLMILTAALTMAASCHRPDDNGPDAERPIGISLTRVTHCSVEARVTPPDESMRWISFIQEKADVDRFASDGELLADDFAWMTDVAEQTGHDIADVITAYSRTGSYEGLLDNELSPETAYTIWLYGIDLEGDALTPVTRASFTTPAFNALDVTFQIDAEVDGNVVTATVTPLDNSVYYYFNLISASHLALYSSIEEAAQGIISQTMSYYGMSPADFVSELCSQGPDAYVFSDLRAGSEFVIFACMVDPATGRVASKVAAKNVRTADAEASANVISVNIEQVQGASVFMSVGTTTEDPYVLIPLAADNYRGMSDQDIASAILDTYLGHMEYILYEGPQETFEMTGLIPGTEYIVIAFGYSNGGVTTGIVRKTFTTPAAGDPSDCRFGFSVTGRRSTYVTVKFSPSDPLSGYFYRLAPASASAQDVRDAISREIREEAGIYEELPFWQRHCARGDVIWKFNDLEPGTEYVPVAVVIDEKKGGFAADVVFGDPFRTLAEGEVPDGEVSLEVALAVPSVMVEGQDEAFYAEYPDHSCLGYAIYGDNIDSGTYKFIPTSMLEGYTEAQYDSLMMFADDLSTGKLSELEREGFYSDVFIMLEPGTSYTFIVQAKDARGNVVRRMATATTAAAPSKARAVLPESPSGWRRPEGRARQ